MVLVFMKMEEISADKPDERGDTILVARFTMVARDSTTGKAAQVNPMLMQSDAEKKLFQMGEDHKAKKHLASEQALTKRPPTEEERFLIHDLYLEYSKYDDPHQKVKKPNDIEWMADTKMSAIQIMQPQDRNIHDKVRAIWCCLTRSRWNNVFIAWAMMLTDIDAHFCVDTTYVV